LAAKGDGTCLARRPNATPGDLLLSMREQTREYLPPHLSVKEVAVWCGVGITMVRRWIAAGRLSAQRVGPRPSRLDRDEVLQLGRTVGGAA
jgi:excisionase family DNA binding protein